MYLESPLLYSLDNRLEALLLGHHGPDLDLEPSPTEIEACYRTQQRRRVRNEQPKSKAIDVSCKKNGCFSRAIERKSGQDI